MSRQITLRDDSGPEFLPAGRPGIGSTGPRCLRFDVHPGEPATVSASLDVEPYEINAGDVLEYDLCAAFDRSNHGDGWWTGGYGATGVAVILETAAATTADLVDQHGTTANALAQGESKTIAVDQWTRVRIPLDTLAGQTIVSAHLQIEAQHDGPVRGWLDGPRITKAKPQPQSAADHVIATRGTNSTAAYSRGNTLPLLSLPHGFAFLTPLTNKDDVRRPYAFHAHNGDGGQPSLDGIALSHIASPWIADWGSLQITFRPDHDDTHHTFSHDDETARAHHYSVRTSHGTLDASPTRSGGVVDITFNSPDTTPELFVGHPSGRTAMRLDDNLLIGHTDAAETIGDKAPRTYVAIGLDPAPTSADGAADQLRVTFDQPHVTLRIASSFISEDAAIAALHREANPTSEEIRTDAHDQWDALLSRVQVDNATDDQLATLYSNLYRLFLYPNEAHEPDPTTGRPVFNGILTEPGTPQPGTLTINNGFWDTYRTAWPAYALFSPTRTRQLLDGFVRHYDDTSWIPRWSAPGPADCMVGTSSDIVIADAAAKGVRLADDETAYDSMVRNATTPSPDSGNGRKGVAGGRFLGFTSNDTPEGLSWSLEGAINDFGIARMAERLLSTTTDPARAAELRAHIRYFGSRAQAYRLLFDPEIDFFRGRNRSGQFDADFRPEAWGGDYTETNAWGMRFSVPHDPRMADLFGGKDGLEARLDEFFATPELADEAVWGHYGFEIHEMVEARDVRMGMLGLSNQPAHHIPFMYAFTDAPHKTQRLTREAVRRLFLGSDLGQGYPGDEDNGEMSAWWLFAAIGLYPLRVGISEWLLTAPLFDRIQLALETGTLTIRTVNNAPSHDYIQRVRINGKDWTGLRVPHNVIAAGADIEIELGPEPSDFGRGSFEQPDPWKDELLVDLGPGWNGRGAVIADPPELWALTDDQADSRACVQRTNTVEWDLERPERPVLYTVTCGDDPAQAPRSWELFSKDRTGQLELLDRRCSETFRWAGQTRVFELSVPTSHDRYVLVFGDAGELCQVELLAPAGTLRGTLRA